MKTSDELFEVYLQALKIASSSNQVVGEKNDLYVTLEELHEIISRLSKERSK
jgi:hypothetical protein